MTYTINEVEYTFSPATMNGTAVIGVRYTKNGESFCEWSAEASLPANAEEAQVMLTQFGWEIVSYTDDFE